MKRKVVVPCSGIGKAFGAVAREAVYQLTDLEHSESYMTICLPLLMTDDNESKQIIRESDVYAIDGCPKKCASVLVAHAGGNLAMELMVPT
ncbi:MAG: putative zinc-binding protein, partial [Candidatus Thorarchaeota archaeon]